MHHSCNIMFDMMRNFKQLNIVDNLGLMPQSEIAVLSTVVTISESSGGKCGVSDIAKELYVSVPAISRTIKKLREKQYVECEIDQLDRRSIYIAVTPEGSKALKNDLEKANLFMKKVFNYLSQDEIDSFIAIYHKIYNGMRSELEKY